MKPPAEFTVRSRVRLLAISTNSADLRKLPSVITQFSVSAPHALPWLTAVLSWVRYSRPRQNLCWIRRSKSICTSSNREPLYQWLNLPGGLRLQGNNAFS